MSALPAPYFGGVEGHLVRIVVFSNPAMSLKEGEVENFFLVA